MGESLTQVFRVGNFRHVVTAHLSSSKNCRKPVRTLANLSFSRVFSIVILPLFARS